MSGERLSYTFYDMKREATLNLCQSHLSMSRHKHIAVILRPWGDFYFVSALGLRAEWRVPVFRPYSYMLYMRPSCFFVLSLSCLSNARTLVILREGRGAGQSSAASSSASASLLFFLGGGGGGGGLMAPPTPDPPFLSSPPLLIPPDTGTVPERIKIGTAAVRSALAFVPTSSWPPASPATPPAAAPLAAAAETPAAPPDAGPLVTRRAACLT